MSEVPASTTPSEQAPQTVNDAIEQALSHLELSPLTIRTYRHGLAAFIRCLHIQDGTYDAADVLAPYPIARITEETLATFGRWLREAYPDPRPGFEGSATRTTRTYLVAARHLMNWLDLRGLLPAGVSFDRMVRRIDAGRGQRRQGYRQRKADPEAVRVLSYYLRQPLPDRPGAKRLVLLRNRALMAVLYDTGMRISEALALTRDDVQDGRAAKVRLTRTKNGHPRTVFLSEESRHLIRAYTAERSDGRYAPLFASHGRRSTTHGAALSPSHAWQIVKDAAKAEGLDPNTSPHSLRHRRAQDLLDEGMPLEWVAALLGHQHTDTTRIVYAWETDEDRLADMVTTYGRSPSEMTKSYDEQSTHDKGEEDPNT
ncbi:MAG: tyrosine-type recombinase/integrase [Anaerolineae bacterium]